MATSIKKAFSYQPAQESKELKAAFDTVLADLTALRTTVAALVTDMGTRITNHNTLIAKLNLDAGVTDANYAAATAITAAAPAALTLTS